MATERDVARAEIARRGLTDAAIGRIIRGSFSSVPPHLYDRARQQLRRFFSDSGWSAGDDAGLAAIAGPGRGWNTDEIAPGVTVEHGWKGTAFRVDARISIETPDAPDAPGAPDGSDAVRETTRTLGDTFEDPMVIESGRSESEIRFITGARTGPTLNATKDAPGDDARVRSLFDQFAEITQLQLEPGQVAVATDDSEQWEKILLPLFDAVSTSFVSAAPATPNRQLDRARAEIDRLDPTDSRDIAKILDAVTSPDATTRAVAVARLAKAETVVAQRPWAIAINDQSRPVRRATARAMAYADAPPPRALLEQALDDKDPGVRYYALRAMGRVGVNPSSELPVERCLRDEDPRVRIAAVAVLSGRTPA